MGLQQKLKEYIPQELIDKILEYTDLPTILIYASKDKYLIKYHILKKKNFILKYKESGILFEVINKNNILYFDKGYPCIKSEYGSESVNRAFATQYKLFEFLDNNNIQFVKEPLWGWTIERYIIDYCIMKYKLYHKMSHLKDLETVFNSEKYKYGGCIDKKLINYCIDKHYCIDKKLNYSCITKQYKNLKYYGFIDKKLIDCYINILEDISYVNIYTLLF